MTSENRRSLCALVLVPALIGSLLVVTSSPAQAYPRPGDTERISTASDGSAGNGHQGATLSDIDMSADGRWVAFGSDADNLVPGDTVKCVSGTVKSCTDIFVKDRHTGKTTMVSVASDGTPANTYSTNPAISDDGRFVAFESQARNLVANDINGLSDVFVHDRDADGDGVFDEPGAISTVRASVSNSGVQATGGTVGSTRPSISSDGRHVAFLSRATNLVSGDSNNSPDVFVRDLVARTTVRVSVAVDGSEAEQLRPPGLNKTAITGKKAISADGRFVLWQTDSENIVPGDTNDVIDVFVTDRDLDGNGVFDEPGGSTTVQVNVATDGAPARIADSGAPLFGSSGGGLSADGRFVVFETGASNLAPGETNLSQDAYLHDRDRDEDGVFDEPGGIETTRVSVTKDGVESPTGGSKPTISPDGRYVAFISREDEIVPGDTNKSLDVFIHDTVTADTERVSVAADGSEANHNSPTAGPLEWEAYMASPMVSNGGRHVAFTSQASNLVPGQTRAAGSFSDVFVRERGAANGVSKIQASVGPNGVDLTGSASLAGLRLVDEKDPAGDALPGALDAGGEVIGAVLAYRPEHQDLLLNIDVAHMASSEFQPRGSLTPGVVHGLELTVAGRRFEVRSSSPRDGTTKVFEGGDGSAFGPNPTRVRTGIFELYECTTVCLPVQNLPGGQGNTGDQIRIGLPLDSIGAEPGSALTDLRVFAAVAAKTDLGNDWDEVVLGDAVIPAASISAGIAPEEVPLEDVVFDTEIEGPAGGAFSGIVATTGLSDGYYKVWAKACLGAEACGAASTDVIVGSPAPKPTPTPTEEPSPTPTGSPTPNPSVSATPSPTASPSVTPSGSPSPTPAPSPGVYPMAPNDTYFGDLWATKRIAAPAAWQEDSATGFGIKVAVVDSGVDLQHEDLQCPRKLQPVAGSDLVDDDSDPDDKFGHGTHVAGIIGACTNNGKGTAGVAPDATIIPIRVLDASGSGGFEDIAGGITKATESGAHVINLSLTGGEISALPVVDFGEVDAAIEDAVSKGVVVVGAAGNSGIPLCEYPALATDVVCVGATDNRDLKAWYSTFPNKTASGATLVAPGGMSTPGVCALYEENIFSLYPKEFDRCDEDRVGYLDTAGTSMAAPHVAGTAALVYNRLGGDRSPANATKVIEALVTTAEDLGVPGWDPVFGDGIVDAVEAVTSVEVVDPPDPDPTATPTPTPTAPPAEPSGRTARVSERADGTVANDYSYQPTMSADGRYVAFTSTATHLVPESVPAAKCGIGLSCSDIFVKNHRTGEVTLVSVASDGTPANAASERAAMSSDGRFVVFISQATNLVPGDANFAKDVFVHDRDRDEDGIFDEPGGIETTLASVASDGTQMREIDRLADWPSISPDGRYVAFASDSSILVPGDSNGEFDVFLHDLREKTTERVSTGLDGTEGDGRASIMGFPSAISDGGRYVSFFSDSANLVPGDTNHNNPLMLGDRRLATNAGFDVFVRDRQKNETVRMSVASDGSEMQGIFEGAFHSSMSSDGRFVAFTTNIGTKLAPQDGNATTDIFVRDRDTDEDGIFDEPDGVATRRVSVASDGAESNGSSTHPVLAADGGHVAFVSNADNLVSDDHSGYADVFVHDLESGITDRASVTSDGAELDADAAAPSISGNGRYVTFWTLATNLPGRPSRDYDIVYMRDRGLAPDVGEVVASVNGEEIVAAGWANLSATTIVDQRDPRDDGLPGATEAGGQMTRSRLVYRGHSNELVMRLELANLNATEPHCCLNMNEAASPAIVYGFEFIHADVRYEARATATAGSAPMFEFFECVNVCLKVADLKGSYGTTGNEVQLVVPRSLFDAGEGATLEEVHTFAAAGPRGWATAPLGNSVMTNNQWDSDRLAQELILPAKEIRLGIAPAGTDRADVTFDIDATKKLSKQDFTTTLDASGLPDGRYDVWAKACLGTENCGAASAPVTIGDPSTEPVTWTTLNFSVRSVGAGQFSDEAFLEARLLDAQGAPISGAELIYELIGEHGAKTVTATTDDEGLGAKTVGLDLRPGAYNLTVRYAGDGEGFDPSADQMVFVVEEEDSALTVSDQGRGAKRGFVAELTDLDTPTNKIAERTVTFFANGEVIGTAITDDKGRAELQAPPGYRGGQFELQAVFEGDPFYRPSSADNQGT